MFRQVRTGRGVAAREGTATGARTPPDRMAPESSTPAGRVRRRSTGAAVALLAAMVLGAACGKYPSARVGTGSGLDATPAAAQAAPTPSAATTPAAAQDQDAAIVGDDGAAGPHGKVITGGTSNVDLSKLFTGTGRKRGGTKGTRTQSPGAGTKSATKRGSRSGTKSGTKSGTGDGAKQADGASPGAPAVSGGPTTPAPADATGMAELISRETTRGARYNSTVLPRGFPFTICPVQGKYSFSDDYGAPRYAGGYHPHAGNDMFAAMGTPIVSPFDGYVSRVPNTLGGNAVEVKGSQGYVYMAHLVAYGITDRNVRAGTVVGFVGNTGDAQATSPHDHFEWHPYSVASFDRVIAGTNGAVDPFPYLQVICPPG